MPDHAQRAASVKSRTVRLVVIHEDAAGDDCIARGVLREFILSGGQVGEVIREFVRHTFVGGVGEPVFEDGAREPGVLIIQRDERVEGGDLYAQRDGGIRESHVSKRELAPEGAVSKTRQPFMPAGAVSLAFQALIVHLFGGHGAFQQSGDPLCRQVQQRKGCIGVDSVLVFIRQRGGIGFVADGKILQAALSVDTHTARADAAQRHGDL